MKVVIFAAILALALAAEEKKEERKPAADERKEEERRSLQWPLPDWSSEGDLMLYGVHMYRRVGELRKVKNLENDVDKMVLSFGREFLRKAHKYLSGTPEFKIMSILCRDSRSLNSTEERWEIRIQPEQQQPVGESQDKQEENQAQQNDAPQQQKEGQEKQNDQQSHPRSKAKPTANDEAKLSNATIDRENTTEARDSYRIQREEFYDHMGENFARLLMRKYRKETLSQEETEYLAHWLDDEAVHYGVMGIYCWNEENVKEIVKQLNLFIEDKQ